jgi:hypothetical protein
MGQEKFLPQDDRQTNVMTAKGFKTTDASGTPKASPLSVTTSESEIVFPSNAVELVIVNTSQDLRIYESTGSSSYCVLPANTGEVIQMGEGGSVFLKGDSATAVVQFYFRTL